MTTPCRICGLPLPDRAGALCPRCLMRTALAAPRDRFPRRFAKYELRRELGRGGVGIVYEAHDPDADRLVALKVLREGDLAAADDVARFEREARRSAALHHAGIVGVLDVGSHDGHPYFTMELVPGGALADHVDDFRRQPRAAARLVADVARSIHYAHQRLVLHRDLKPANILLDHGGRPRVADFGVAQRLDASTLTAPAGLRGTLPYMAPEQIASPSDLTVAVDVYGLGAVLYELLCGRPPIAGATMAELARNVVEQEPIPPRALAGPDAPDLDVDLETICMKCLRKVPGDRYASAAGVAADLDRYLADEPIAARRPTRRERLARTVRRHPTSSVLAAIAALLLGTTAGVAVSVARAQEKELRGEALKVNAYAARALSGAVSFELRALADELVERSRQPALAALLAHPDDAQAATAWAAHALPPRFDSMMVSDTRGRALARAGRSDHDVTGLLFDWRDYFVGSARLGRAGLRRVHFGRAYRSKADGTVRFSLSTPLYDAAGAWCGVLEAAVGTATALGDLALIDPAEQGRVAVLVALRDRDEPDDPLPDDWLVLLHEGVAHGSWHRMANRGGLAELAAARAAAGAGERPGFPVPDDDHRDPVPGFEGRWLAGMAPVGSTPFAMVVQTRYDTAVAATQRLAGRLRKGFGATLGIAIAIGALVVGITRARRARRMLR